MSAEPDKPRMPWENDDPDAPWVPENLYKKFNKNYDLERALHPEEGDSPEATARRLFRENAPVAAMAIIHCATHGSTERVRFDASRYVIERVLGKVGEDAFGDDKSPIEGFLDEVTEFVQAAANTSGGEDE